MSHHIAAFIDTQRSNLEQGNIERFLQDLTQCMRDLEAMPELLGRQLPSPIFDLHCQQAGTASAFELCRPQDALPLQPHNIVLLTEIMAQGGHAEIVNDIVRNSAVPVLLVVTNINQRKRAIPDSLRDDPRLAGLVLADEKTLLDKLRTVQAALSAPQAERIFMLTHAYDAVAVSAITPDLSGKTSYLHHCDHKPALGCHLPGVVHMDLHNIGHARCRHEYNASDNRYLCLTSDGEQLPPARRQFASRYFISVSCGSAHKLAGMDYPVSYEELVLRVLKRRGGMHFHLGHLSASFLDRMSALLLENGLSAEQFCSMGEAPKLPAVLRTLDADLYFPTLPQSGGKALVDAMAAGLPVMLHQHGRDRLWGSSDLAYPEAPTWRNLDQVDTILDRFDADYWAVQAQASRTYFNRFHSNCLFARLLHEGGARAGSDDIPPLKPYLPDLSIHLRCVSA